MTNTPLALEHTALETKYYELSYMRHDPEAMLHSSLKEVTDFLNDKIKGCNESGFRLTNLDIRWKNVPHPQMNPFMDRGYMRVVLTREKVEL